MLGAFYLDYSKSFLCFMFDDDNTQIEKPLFVYADCKIVYGFHFCQNKMFFNNGEKLKTLIQRQATQLDCQVTGRW
jgi:hypothetical protein